MALAENHWLHTDFQIGPDIDNFLLFPTFMAQVTQLVTQSMHLKCLTKILGSEVTGPCEREGNHFLLRGLCSHH